MGTICNLCLLGVPFLELISLTVAFQARASEATVTQTLVTTNRVYTACIGSTFVDTREALINICEPKHDRQQSCV